MLNVCIICEILVSKVKLKNEDWKRLNPPIALTKPQNVSKVILKKRGLKGDLPMTGELIGPGVSKVKLRN